ncbi:MAG: hypothetical protein ACRDY7_01575 [Acidimicrobiia bacterium]
MKKRSSDRGLEMNDMMDRMMDRNQWDATIIGLWIVVIALAVGVTVLAFKVFAKSGSPVRARDDGIRILDERYARGDIHLDEYEERRRQILAGHH